MTFAPPGLGLDVDAPCVPQEKYTRSQKSRWRKVVRTYHWGVNDCSAWWISCTSRNVEYQDYQSSQNELQKGPVVRPNFAHDSTPVFSNSDIGGKDECLLDVQQQQHGSCHVLHEVHRVQQKPRTYIPDACFRDMLQAVRTNIPHIPDIYPVEAPRRVLAICDRPSSSTDPCHLVTDWSKVGRQCHLYFDLQDEVERDFAEEFGDKKFAEWFRQMLFALHEEMLHQWFHFHGIYDEPEQDIVDFLNAVVTSISEDDLVLQRIPCYFCFKTYWCSRVDVQHVKSRMALFIISNGRFGIAPD